MAFEIRHCISICFLQKARFHTTRCNFQGNRIVNVAEKLVQEKWEEKMKYWMRKYEDLFGITKLSELHSRVLEVQENIQKVQEKRRKIQENIFVAQKKLQESQDILHKTSMGDDMYITLVTQVRELLKEQARLRETFSLYDQTEREYQMTLALAINSSQDHERTYREKNKYLSLITGVVGGLLGLLGSSINNWRHRKDIKLFARDISNQVTDLEKHLEKLRLPISSSEKVISKTGSLRTEQILTQLDLQQKELENSVKSIELLLNNKNFTIYENPDNMTGEIPVKQILHKLEGNLDSKLRLHTAINVGMVTSLLILGSFIFYISNSH